MTNTYCCIRCWASWWWTVDLSETDRVLFQNKFEKQCISLAFIIGIYHDAQSYECQICIKGNLLSQTFMGPKWRWRCFGGHFIGVWMYFCQVWTFLIKYPDEASWNSFWHTFRFDLNGGKVALNIISFRSTLLRDEITNSELYGQMIVS